MKTMKMTIRINDGPGVLMALNPDDLKLSFEDFSQRYLFPAYAQLQWMVQDSKEASPKP
jgi:hypothetical protein